MAWGGVAVIIASLTTSESILGGGGLVGKFGLNRWHNVKYKGAYIASENMCL
jgi:hypothetical protein